MWVAVKGLIGSILRAQKEGGNTNMCLVRLRLRWPWCPAASLALFMELGYNLDIREYFRIVIGALWRGFSLGRWIPFYPKRSNGSVILQSTHLFSIHENSSCRQPFETKTIRRVFWLKSWHPGIGRNRSRSLVLYVVLSKKKWQFYI
jgi:hypothetical protein